jgi:hypothetical protein
VDITALRRRLEKEKFSDTDFCLVHGLGTSHTSNVCPAVRQSKGQMSKTLSNTAQLFDIARDDPIPASKMRRQAFKSPGFALDEEEDDYAPSSDFGSGGGGSRNQPSRRAQRRGAKGAWSRRPHSGSSPGRTGNNPPRQDRHHGQSRGSGSGAPGNGHPSNRRGGLLSGTQKGGLQPHAPTRQNPHPSNI